MATLMSLPAELRIIIWKLSFPEPRNVVLSWTGQDFSTNVDPPNLASICRESREELSKQYDLSFAMQDSTPKTWFDFSRDVLYITDEALERVPKETLSRVGNLKHFRYTGVMAQRCTS